MDYIFDETFKGLLCAVFDCFERKDFTARLHTAHSYRNSIFGVTHQVYTDEQHALRVWQGLKKIVSPEHLRKLYVSFLCEQPDIYDKLFQVMSKTFQLGVCLLQHYGDAAVLTIHQAAKRVEREQHRMKAFVRFQKSKDGLYFSVIEPDFNIIPLITRFFKERYADQRWLIYDAKRKYGVYYDLKHIQEITLNVSKKSGEAVAGREIMLDVQEDLYNRLWQDYFRSTNIASRKNLKLHVRHVPKRYWRYLTEKQP